MFRVCTAFVLSFCSMGAVAGAVTVTPQASQIELILKNLADNHTPGLAVMVRKNGRTTFERGYGITDLKSKRPIDSHTDFRLASCTKQFTAMSIMLLVHAGKLRYDEPITDVFPEFPDYGRVITIRNLLNHTSGLPDYESLMDQSPDRTRWSATNQIHDDEVLKLLESQQHGKFAPGSRWSYSNSGYVVLGLIVARVSGESFPAFLHDRIFSPLGMSHTLAFVNGTSPIPDRAYGHTKQGNQFVQTDQSSTSATLGDGGIYSDLEDLAKWDDALTRHTLLSANDMRPALTPVKLADGSIPDWSSDPGDSDPQAGKPVLYGFGWFLDDYQGKRRMWHYGETTGFRTMIDRFLQSQLTVVVLCNRTDLNPQSLASKIAGLY